MVSTKVFLLQFGENTIFSSAKVSQQRELLIQSAAYIKAA